VDRQLLAGEFRGASPEPGIWLDQQTRVKQSFGCLSDFIRGNLRYMSGETAKSGTLARFTVQMAIILQFSFSSFLFIMALLVYYLDRLHIGRENSEE
jgi:hypothetical protein